MTMDAPSKLSTYLASGIPVVVKNNLAQSEFIDEHHIGYCVANLEEAAEKVKEISDEQYATLSRNANRIGNMIRDGFFTKRALIDAVFLANI